jgi:hypothetical protein
MFLILIFHFSVIVHIWRSSFIAVLYLAKVDKGNYAE